MMTPDGLKKMEDLDQQELKKGKFKMKIDKDGVDIEAEPKDDNKDDKKGGDYRYDDKKQQPKSDTTVVKVITDNNVNTDEDENTSTSQVIKTKADTMVKTIKSSSNIISPLMTMYDLF